MNQILNQIEENGIDLVVFIVRMNEVNNINNIEVLRFWGIIFDFVKGKIFECFITVGMGDMQVVCFYKKI